MPIELIRQVVAGSDDCYRRLTTSLFSLTSEYLAVGYNGESNKQWGGGMRFVNITIPKGSTILTAKLTFQCYASDAAAGVNTRISAEDVDDPATFADNAAAFDTRWAARTTERQDWDNIEAWTIGENYDSVDFKAVIQEIIDREGWASGQDIVIFWEDFEDRSTGLAGQLRRAKSYEHGDNAPPKLTITYSEVANGLRALEPARVTPLTVPRTLPADVRALAPVR